MQITRYPQHDSVRRMKLLNYHQIDCVLDIGANEGQYAIEMRDLGFPGKIVSFEPLRDAYLSLQRKAAKDKNWFAENYALGLEDSKGQINVAGNSLSSSILDMSPTHLESAPESGYVDQQEIEIKKMDSIFNRFCEPGNKVMVKIDTQGFEKQVLDGAPESLKKISLLQLEMSLVELYDNEMLFREMIDYLDNLGFKLVSLENGFSNPKSGELLQVDGIFVNGR